MNIISNTNSFDFDIPKEKESQKQNFFMKKARINKEITDAQNEDDKQSKMIVIRNEFLMKIFKRILRIVCNNSFQIFLSFLNIIILFLSCYEMGDKT